MCSRPTPRQLSRWTYRHVCLANKNGAGLRKPFPDALHSCKAAIQPMRSGVVVTLAAIAVILLSEVPGIRSLNRIDLAAATKERGS